MKRVVLESPFAGNIARNVAYAKLCMKDMLSMKEAPIASHLLWTQPGLLDDGNPEQRKLGIGAGHAWIRVADYVAVYDDFGISKGMEIGIMVAANAGVPIYYRKLPETQVVYLLEKYPDIKLDPPKVEPIPQEKTSQDEPAK